MKNGELDGLVDQGVTGVTSNPTIFAKAIAESTDYDDAILELAKSKLSVQEVYESLAIADIRDAADRLRGVYDDTDGKDGYVSFEVSPKLAHDATGTVAEARRLYEAVGKPNVMIKVPGTPAGLPAITELISAGINVNMTLLFALANYRDVVLAFFQGLESLADTGPDVTGGHGIDRVSSVASFFVSRVDAAVDKSLKESGNDELQGKIAIANAKAVYRETERLFSSSQWTNLAGKGARKQRPLWASTGTKNPSYPDTLYVDQLIGPDTVNTVPPSTLDAFLDHGNVAPTLGAGTEQALMQLEALASSGIKLDDITSRLQDEGVKSFADSFDTLLQSVETKIKQLQTI